MTTSRDSGTIPLLHIPGDARHGVTIAAREAARAVRVIRPAVREIDDSALDGSASDPVHLHFTDRLWARTPEDAASRIERIGEDRSLVVTLHDIPQPSDGPRNLPRRVEAYRRVVAAVRGVVVNSEHERSLLVEQGIEARTLAVIPLPLEPNPGPVGVENLDEHAAILGFFYPGKGHDEIVDALADLRDGSGLAAPGTGLVSLGGVSPGHDGERDALVARAAERGVRVEVTGYLADDEMLAACRRAAVPVVAHRHFSASGSLNTWIAAGRRPLVVDSRYAREMAALRPGTVTLVQPDGWGDALAAALRDPGSTVLGPEAVLRPSHADAAAALVDFWERIL